MRVWAAVETKDCETSREILRGMCSARIVNEGDVKELKIRIGRVGKER